MCYPVASAVVKTSTNTENEEAEITTERRKRTYLKGVDAYRLLVEV
jgi:hypothetical protein